jgi:exosortase A-associated hydrolase 2
VNGLAAGFEPLFLDGTEGRLFAIHHRPDRSGPAARALLYLPPFAEEMNRSRRVAALVARRLAASGRGTLLLDPFGCGDSEGEFAEARWETWRSDVTTAIRFLTGRGYREIALLGLRLGALLALDAAARSEEIERVVLWQPVLRGDQMLTQFLRLRLASGLTAGKTAAGGETTTALRNRLKSGETLEIAGYELAPALALAIDALRLGELGATVNAPIDWVAIETAEAPPPPAQQEILDEWRHQSRSVAYHRVVVEPFWTLQETTLAPALVEFTAHLLQGDTT